MIQLAYLAKRIKTLDFHSFFATILDASQKSHRPKFVIFCDIVYCGLVYGAGHTDYGLSEYFNLNLKQRKTFVTVIPNWKKACDVCVEMANMVPKIGYIGWDIAVTDSGVDVIEGNPFPGHGFLQMPPHTPDKIGFLPLFKKYVDL